MKPSLFVVSRPGHDGGENGPDDYNTVYLIRATSHRCAAGIADERLVNQSSDRRLLRWATRVYRLSDLVDGGEDGVILGPAVDQGYTLGAYPQWERRDQHGKWEFSGPCPSCGFDAYNEQVENEQEVCPRCGWGREFFE